MVVPGVRLVIEEEKVVAAVVASSDIGWFSILWMNTLRLKLRHIVALSQLETERNYTRTTHSNLRVLVQFAFKLG